MLAGMDRKERGEVLQAGPEIDRVQLKLYPGSEERRKTPVRKYFKTAIDYH